MILNNYLNENLHIETSQSNIDYVSYMLEESAIQISLYDESDYFFQEGVGDVIKNAAGKIWKGIKFVFEKIVEALKWLKSKTIDKIINFVKSKFGKSSSKKQADAVEKQIASKVKAKIEEKKSGGSSSSSSSKPSSTSSTSTSSNTKPKEDNKSDSDYRDYDYDEDNIKSSTDSNNHQYNYSDAIDDLKLQIKLDKEEMELADKKYIVKYLDINKIFNNESISKVISVISDCIDILDCDVNSIPFKEEDITTALEDIASAKKYSLKRIFQTNGSTLNEEDMGKMKNTFYENYKDKVNNGYTVIKFSEFTTKKESIAKDIDSKISEYIKQLNSCKSMIDKYISQLTELQNKAHQHLLQMLKTKGTDEQRRKMDPNYKFSDKEIADARKNDNKIGKYDSNKQAAKKLEKRAQKQNGKNFKTVEQRFVKLVSSQLAAMNVIIGALNYRISVESAIVKVVYFVYGEK